jgi:hypothetical protein
MYGAEERCMQDFVGKPGRERLLGRARRRLEDFIKVGLREMGGFRLH